MMDLEAPPDALLAIPDQFASRSTDPATSHLAEREINASGARVDQSARVLELVRARPGATSAELAGDDYRLRIAARKRLPDLERAGLVVRGEEFATCSVTGRLSLTWWPR